MRSCACCLGSFATLLHIKHTHSRPAVALSAPISSRCRKSVPMLLPCWRMRRCAFRTGKTAMAGSGRWRRCSTTPVRRSTRPRIASPVNREGAHNHIPPAYTRAHTRTHTHTHTHSHTCARFAVFSAAFFACIVSSSSLCASLCICAYDCMSFAPLSIVCAFTCVPSTVRIHHRTALICARLLQCTSFLFPSNISARRTSHRFSPFAFQRRALLTLLPSILLPPPLPLATPAFHVLAAQLPSLASAGAEHAHERACLARVLRLALGAVSRSPGPNTRASKQAAQGTASPSHRQLLFQHGHRALVSSSKRTHVENTRREHTPPLLHSLHASIGHASFVCVQSPTPTRTTLFQHSNHHHHHPVPPSAWAKLLCATAGVLNQKGDGDAALEV